MDLNDVFGQMSERPDHPDFWRLVEVVLANDAATDPSDATLTNQQREANFEERMGSIIDTKSVSYMALQRAMRPLGITTRADMIDKLGLLRMLSSVWLDGFAAGGMFEQRKTDSST